AGSDAVVDLALEVGDEPLHAQGEQQTACHLRDQVDLPVDDDVERIVGHPGYDLRRAVGRDGEADFHLEAAAAHTGGRQVHRPYLAPGRAGHADLQPQRGHSWQPHAEPDAEVDRPDLQRTHVEPRLVLELFGAARQRIDDVRLDVVQVDVGVLLV